MKWNLMMVLGILSFARQLENVAVENQKNMIRAMVIVSLLIYFGMFKRAYGTELDVVERRVPFKELNDGL
jgi:uncharacterized membrane protein